MSEWQDISTAPRDGSLVYVAAVVGDDEPPDFDAGPYLMRWHADARSPMVPGVVGLWIGENTTACWDESRGRGPTHWMPHDITFH